MTKTQHSSRKLTETDRTLLENLGKFCIRAKHSTWEAVTHTSEVETVSIFNEVGKNLTSTEHRELTEGWSHYRLTGDDTVLNGAVEFITQRIQDRVESF
jgi:hypothetical protein